MSLVMIIIFLFFFLNKGQAFNVMTNWSSHWYHYYDFYSLFSIPCVISWAKWTVTITFIRQSCINSEFLFFSRIYFLRPKICQKLSRQLYGISSTFFSCFIMIHVSESYQFLLDYYCYRYCWIYQLNSM